MRPLIVIGVLLILFGIAALAFQGVTIPGLTVRRVRTNIELSPGQSFAIGGLLDRRLTDTIDKIPLLGDIPGLGWLFKNSTTTSSKTELLVFITPRVVNDRLTMR